jgi:DNA end-binding protein Ku
MKNRHTVSPQAKSSARRRNETARQGMWSGTISFSLVAIPVQLVKAVEPGRVSFHLLHGKDHSPLLRRMVCPADGKIVPPEDMVRGYEISPDQYLVITDEELESLSPERSRTIEIIEFIDIGEVDAVYYDHPYYLVPLKGGEKAYQLLVSVMRRANKAGIAKFILGEREYLVAVQSTGEALALIILHYHAEILSDEGIVPEAEKIDATDKSPLKKIISDMLADFNPDKYADDRRQQIRKFLEQKMKNKAVVEAPEIDAGEGEGPIDLVAVLEESMRKLKGA